MLLDVWFLGVHFECGLNTEFFNVTQNCLIIDEEYVVPLGNGIETADVKYTHPKTNLLAKHVHGKNASSHFNHNGAFWELLYLASHACPNSPCAANCAIRYIICLKIVHTHKIVNSVFCCRTKFLLTTRESFHHGIT